MMKFKLIKGEAQGTNMHLQSANRTQIKRAVKLTDYFI